MLEPLFNIPALYSLALTLLHFLWQGALIAAALKLVLLFIDKNEPQLRYIFCSLAMIANLVVAIVTFNIISPENISLSELPTQPLLTSLVNDFAQQSTLFSVHELFLSLLLYLLPYISIAWLSVVFILVCKILIEIRNVNLLPNDQSILPSTSLQLRFIELTQQLNLHTVPKLLISMKAEVPMAIGFIKPVVLIPSSMVTGLSPAQLEMLILHELAHIRRHDYLVNFLQTIIEILFFFHPSVHWVAKVMRNEREYCSDDIAVKECGDPIAYAHTLTDTASLCLKHQHTIPSMAMAASGGDLKQRVIRLIDHHCAPKNEIGKWFAAMSVFLFITIFSMVQLLTSASNQQWKQHFPWQNQYSSAALVTNNNYLSDTQNKSINNKKDSIAQQLLIARNKDKEQNTGNNNIVTMNDSFTDIEDDMSLNNALVDIKPRKNLRIKNNSAPLPVATSKMNTLIAHNQPSENMQGMDHIALNNQSSPLPINEEHKSDSFSTLRTPKKLTKPFNDINNDEIISLGKIAKQSKKTFVDNKVKITRFDENKAFNEDNILVIEQGYIEKSRYEQQLIDELSVITNHQMGTSTLNAKTFRQFKQAYVNLSRHDLSQGEHDAKQLKSVNPVYPSIAKRKGIEIEVEVKFTIDKNGEVKNINFSQKNKLNYFKNSIRTAMRKWRFIPAKVGNKAIESQMSKIFSFSLQS